MPTVGDIVQVMESHYPPELAESWDKVGLSVGDPDDTVKKIAFALDPTLDVVREAIDAGAQMLITHHPLLLKGINSLLPRVRRGASSTRRLAMAWRFSPRTPTPTRLAPVSTTNLPGSSG